MSRTEEEANLHPCWRCGSKNIEAVEDAFGEGFINWVGCNDCDLGITQLYTKFVKEDLIKAWNEGEKA